MARIRKILDGEGDKGENGNEYNQYRDGRREENSTMNQPITIDTIWMILNDEIDDAMVNRLLWESLGYCWQEELQQWDNEKVADEWRHEYPEPPDFIENRPPTVKLTRSIPPENKQLLKEKLGFKGYKIGEFTPRMTRRATAANWLLGYILRGQSE
jgi:hypothetical protein